MLWIRVFCLDPELMFRIRHKVKEHINKTVNSGLFLLLDSSIDEFKGVFLYYFGLYTYLINIGWIQICMDPELLPGSGDQKIQSWIRIRNKSFRIHNTGCVPTKCRQL